MAKEQTTEKKYYKKTTKKTTFNQYNLTFCDTSTGEILKQTEENCFLYFFNISYYIACPYCVLLYTQELGIPRSKRFF